MHDVERNSHQIFAGNVNRRGDIGEDENIILKGNFMEV
jgi:hypothetical protein